MAPLPVQHTVLLLWHKSRRMAKIELAGIKGCLSLGGLVEIDAFVLHENFKEDCCLVTVRCFPRRHFNTVACLYGTDSSVTLETFPKHPMRMVHSSDRIR